MRPSCEACGLKFEREPGYFLGAIYINYGLTAMILTVVYLSFALATDTSHEVLLVAIGAFCLLFPLWFFRYARSLWLGFDAYIDPMGQPKAAVPAAKQPTAQ